MRAGLTLRLAIFSGLTLPLWLVSGSSHADRVLSLTVVGDGRGPNLTAEQPALTSPAGTGPADVPTDRERVLVVPPVEQPTELPQSVSSSTGLDIEPRFRVSGSVGASVYRSSAAPTDTTDLVFDPVGSSFSLAGRESGLSVSYLFPLARLGVTLTRGSARGEVTGYLENPNVRYIDTTVELEHRALGVFVGDSADGGGGVSSVRLGLERSSHDLTVSNDYRHGLFFGVPSVVRRYRTTDLTVGLRHDYVGPSGLGIHMGQSYRVPLGAGFGVTGSSVNLGLSQAFGPGLGDTTGYRLPSEDCDSLEVFGSSGVSALSGSSHEQNTERLTRYGVDSALGWDGTAVGGRRRFSWGDGCGFGWAAFARKSLAYGTGYIEQLQPVVYTDPFESTGTLTLSGLEVGVGRQLELTRRDGRRGYLLGALTGFIGEGTVAAVSQFGSNVERTTAPSRGALIGLRVGSGYQVTVGRDRYLFYEVSVGRYDARPFGNDLRGWRWEWISV